MICIGVGGHIELGENSIIIRRTGVMSLVLHGVKGEKTIPFSSIHSVQFKRPNFVNSGFIQFAVAGGLESGKGILAATKDENTVMFLAGHEKDFEKLREVVESRIGVGPSSTVVGKVYSPAEELEKLAGLVTQGFLTEEEFLVQKEILLKPKIDRSSAGQKEAAPTGDLSSDEKAQRENEDRAIARAVVENEKKSDVPDHQPVAFGRRVS